MRRLIQDGIWLRVALLNVVASTLIVWAFAIRQDQTRQRSDRQVRTAYIKALAATNAKFTYAINRSSCAAYSLVDPTIRANNTLIAALNRAVHDPNTAPAVLAQDKTRLKSVTRQNTAFQSFRSIYGTIPLGFDCHKLPKKPPS